MGSGGSTGGGWPAQLVVIIKSCRHFFSSTGQKLEEKRRGAGSGQLQTADMTEQLSVWNSCSCCCSVLWEYELAAITSWKGNAVNWVVLAKNNTESCYSWCDRSGCSD